MNDMNPRAIIGGNSPPEPVDMMLTIQAAYDGVFAEVANWLDGSPVENDDQMRAVDTLMAEVKAAAKEASDAKESEYRPHKDACDAVVARWKVFLDDLDRQAKGLAAIVGNYKRKREAERQESERLARIEAAKKREAAESAARTADAANIEAQREAAQSLRAADAAQREVAAIAKDKTRGLRTVQRHEITDHRAALHWIAANDRDAITAFIEEYVRRNFKDREIDGVKKWTDKEAF